MQSISTAKKSMRRLVAIVLLAIAAECLLTPNAYADECFALESKQDVETNGSAEDFFRDWAENLEPLVHLRTKFPVELGEISEAELGVVRIDLRNFVYGKHLFREISMPRLVRSLVFARRAMVQNNEKTLRQVFQQTRAVPYFGNFLYGLTFSYKNSNAMRRMILAEHHDFVGARIIDAERGFVMTGSFEKESVSDSIGNIYQLGSNSQPLKGMTPQKINEHSSHSQLRADAPQYLTTKYEQEASNHVVEFKHASAEVDLQKIPQEVTQVARLMGEENGFHWHLVWPAEYLQPAEYERFKAWWTHLNDYLTLYGIERGQFPGTYSLPANPREDHVPEDYVKLRSAGFRRGVYGKGRDGIELRDVAKTVAETNRIYQQMSDSVANKSWNEFQVRTWVATDQMNKSVVIIHTNAYFYPEFQLEP